MHNTRIEVQYVSTQLWVVGHFGHLNIATTQPHNKSFLYNNYHYGTSSDMTYYCHTTQ